MKAYKLTDQNLRTHKDFQWEIGVRRDINCATDVRNELCSPAYFHFYRSPLIAVFCNPRDANIKNPKLFECLTYGQHKHETLKSGCKGMTLIKEIPAPEITLNAKIAWGILCVKEVYKSEKWNSWADNWLSRKDKSKDAAAYAAAYAVDAAADAAAYAAAYAADAAAYAAAYAAAAYVAAYVAAAAYAAAANAAAAVTKTNIKINFVSLAKKAIKLYTK